MVSRRSSMRSAQRSRIAILALVAAVTAMAPSRAAEDRPAGTQAAADAALADSLGSSRSLGRGAARLPRHPRRLDGGGARRGRDLEQGLRLRQPGSEARGGARHALQHLLDLEALHQLWACCSCATRASSRSTSRSRPICPGSTPAERTPTAHRSRCAASSRTPSGLAARVRRSPTGPVPTSRSRPARR